MSNDKLRHHSYPPHNLNAAITTVTAPTMNGSATRNIVPALKSEFHQSITGQILGPGGGSGPPPRSGLSSMYGRSNDHHISGLLPSNDRCIKRLWILAVLPSLDPRKTMLSAWTKLNVKVPPGLSGNPPGVSTSSPQAAMSSIER